MTYTWKIGYLRAILLVSCLLLGAMLTYNSLVVYPSFTRMLTLNTEEEAVRVASYLMTEVLGEADDLHDVSGIADRIQDARDQFRLWKIKIFSATGEIVYSTEAADIGTVNSSLIFTNELPAGHILSKVVRKDGKSTEGQVVPLDITETYVPILKEGTFLGAFEIYYDITQRKARQDQNLRKSTLVSAAIAVLFFGALIFILERTGKSIVERQIAEQKLIEYQKHLVESEKMASLGGLVAGVAHEINTPVGAAVTVASSLDERTRQCRELLLNNQIKRSDLQKYFETATSSAAVILSSLRQAAELIKSFKQVAVDQSCQEKRTFRIRECIEDVLLSLKPKFRQGAHQVEVICPEDLEINQYPGVMTQIFTNLVMNSLTHGFAQRDQGRIRFDVQTTDSLLRIRYEDDGVGMSAETLQRIFEPFFTTRRGQGGSGLGMHITYNLVSQTLGGTIACDSSPGQGAVFTLCVPLN
ncbi:sensor histidine kinase [Geoalkalibacter sp.]|uniref:sensor histidine kinase n=1 Tax=Geoalkalibacter sp. TaxID=3041440 RepID=UPI00272E8E1F|nr:HAMP domain-containing sensor histidine kinase [Geoalkalibacter sp.]